MLSHESRGHDSAGDTPKEAANKSFAEQVLSPIALQRMMSCGGGLLVIGFIGWLWSIGIFENPIVAAVSIGAANLTLLGLGIALFRFTKYELAGTGITLLSALAMPLNLWFYDAQGLVTIAEGGHLWVPAAACCGIYAMIARTLKKPVFVYTLVGGIVMTGLLILADQSVGHFWELLPQSTFLVIAGWVCIHAERMFAAGKGPFSQQNFGRAFHRAGMTVLAGGLGLLLGGHIVSLLYDFCFQNYQIPSIASDRGLKLWAIALITGSAFGFVGEHFFNRTRKYNAGLASGLFVWAMLATLDLFHISPRIAHLGILAAAIVAARNIWCLGQGGEWRYANRNSTLLTCCLLVILGIGTFAVEITAQTVTWTTIVQLLVTTIACLTAFARYGSRVEIGRPDAGPFLELASISGALASAMTAIAIGYSSLHLVALVCLLPAIFFTVASCGKVQPATRQQIKRAAAMGCGVALVCMLLPPLGALFLHASHLEWAGLHFITAGIFFASCNGDKLSGTRILAITSVIAGICRGIAATGLSIDYALVLSATVGGLILAAIAAGQRKRLETNSPQVSSLHKTGNILIVGGSVVGILMTLSRVAVGGADGTLLIVQAIQLAAIALGSFLTSDKAWRLSFRAVAIGTVGAWLAALNDAIDMHWLHRAELLSVLSGFALLAIGHIVWYREGEQQDEAATYGLFFGSLLASTPLAIGLIFYRSELMAAEWNWMMFHEIAAVITGTVLLGLGLACRIRSTTIAGSSLLTIYVLSLVALIRLPSQLQSASVVMMICGALFFATAVVLSMYRDRIMSLPQHAREGKGVFRVLRWR